MLPERQRWGSATEDHHKTFPANLQGLGLLISVRFHACLKHAHGEKYLVADAIEGLSVGALEVCCILRYFVI